MDIGTGFYVEKVSFPAAFGFFILVTISFFLKIPSPHPSTHLLLLLLVLEVVLPRFAHGIDWKAMTDTTGRATVLYRQSRGVGEEPQGSGDHRAGEAGQFNGRRRWYVVDIYSTFEKG